MNVANAQIAALEEEVARLTKVVKLCEEGDAPFIALAEASKEIWRLIEEGWLVRNTTNDSHFPSYMAKATQLVSALKTLSDALAHPSVKQVLEP